MQNLNAIKEWDAAEAATPGTLECFRLVDGNAAARLAGWNLEKDDSVSKRNWLDKKEERVHTSFAAFRTRDSREAGNQYVLRDACDASSRFKDSWKSTCEHSMATELCFAQASQQDVSAQAMLEHEKAFSRLFEGFCRITGTGQWIAVLLLLIWVHSMTTSCKRVPNISLRVVYITFVLKVEVSCKYVQAFG